MKEPGRLLVLASSMALALVLSSAGRAEEPLFQAGPVAIGSNGHVYQLVPVELSWTEARDAAAASLGVLSHLVTVTSAEENALVCGLLRSSVALPAGGTWIGLTDREVEGDFRWVTGEPLAYTNWAAGQPDDFFGEDAVEMLGPANQPCKWNDRTSGSSSSTYFIVEYEL